MPASHDADPALLLLAMGPVFLLSIAVEAWHWHRRGRAIYAWRDVASNAALALMHQGADAFVLWLFVRTVYTFCYEHGLHLFPRATLSFLALLLLQDLLYYGFHRASHRIRWMWASHVTHHSSQRMNLSTAFRQSLTYPLSGMWLFWVPLAWLGFPPDWVILSVGLNLGFQFFVHTQLAEPAGPIQRALGRVINTPSIHRVHHGRNPDYMDRNYAGVLTVWDRLFGTYVEETEPVRYGITRQIESHNPLTLTFHEWRDMWRDVLRHRDLRHLWMPPDWIAPASQPSA
ncbi:MAG TPA: sterol desaturase family protein [Burkholderiaceae bacterium]|nr:sterol desaturase family protein [Burkholderiaceae bacterium]